MTFAASLIVQARLPIIFFRCVELSNKFLYGK